MKSKSCHSSLCSVRDAVDRLTGFLHLADAHSNEEIEGLTQSVQENMEQQNQLLNIVIDGSVFR